MDTNEAANWTRHFDSLLWQVTSIFASAIGALLAYSYSNFETAIAIAGLFFSITPVYFGASFRELRCRLSNHLDSELKAALGSGRKLYQWQLFVSIFIVFQALWVWLLVKEVNNYWWLWVIFGFISMSITYKLSSIGKATVHESSV